jgi:hypothetical protein
MPFCDSRVSEHFWFSPKKNSGHAHFGKKDSDQVSMQIIRQADHIIIKDLVLVLFFSIGDQFFSHVKT